MIADVYQSIVETLNMMKQELKQFSKSEKLLEKALKIEKEIKDIFLEEIMNRQEDSFKSQSLQEVKKGK